MKSILVLLSILTISMSASAQSGFQLTEVKKNSIYEKLGLKKGDVLKSYNGKPIHSADDAKGLYDALKSQPHIKIEIERNGESKKIETDLKNTKG